MNALNNDNTVYIRIIEIPGSLPLRHLPGEMLCIPLRITKGSRGLGDQ